MSFVPRPKCVHCGKTYGSRHTTTETVRWGLNDYPPRYSGNAVLIKDISPPYSHTLNRASARAVTMMSSNPAIRASQEADLATLPEQSYLSGTRVLWDGESWYGGYRPFCTLRCALDYARKAYLAHVKTS